MSLEVAPTGPVSFNAVPDPAARRSPVAGDAATISSEIPPSPPPEVLEAMDAASRCYQQLHAQGRELRFDVDDASGRVTVAVCDLDGNVLERIPASRVLDVATGGSLD